MLLLLWKGITLQLRYRMEVWNLMRKFVSCDMRVIWNAFDEQIIWVYLMGKNRLNISNLKLKSTFTFNTEFVIIFCGWNVKWPSHANRYCQSLSKSVWTCNGSIPPNNATPISGASFPQPIVMAYLIVYLWILLSQTASFHYAQIMQRDEHIKQRQIEIDRSWCFNLLHKLILFFLQIL